VSGCLLAHAAQHRDETTISIHEKQKNKKYLNKFCNSRNNFCFTSRRMKLGDKFDTM
jgi:hypothetical protein